MSLFPLAALGSREPTHDNGAAVLAESNGFGECQWRPRLTYLPHLLPQCSYP